MKKKKILVKGPVLSRSGYGEQSRIALRALRSREDLFEIFLFNIPWGNTGRIALSENNEMSWIHERMMATTHHQQAGSSYDLSLQITIPNEFENIAPINIGYTAGIETDRIAPEWVQPSNMVDKLITISNHSKNVFEQTTYTARNEGTGEEIKDFRVLTPIEVVNYPFYEYDPEPLDLGLTTTNNFLAVSQWAPRKNMENTIKWFVEEFREDETVGLILKTNTVSDSFIDREMTTRSIQQVLSQLGDKKCKIYLLHGGLTVGELTWLYQHPTMKALINIAHGEGYGLPLFEAAYNALPLITVPWSGQMDFICKPNKKGKDVPLVTKVDYDLNKVQPSVVWEGVITTDSKWAYARETSYKRALREVLDKAQHVKSRAINLQKHIRQKFNKEVIYKQFVEAVYGESTHAVDNKELPTISILTSVYDGDEFIRPFLDDMVKQTVFDKCELILVDANSPGNEEEIIKEYIEKYDNIIYKKLEKDPGIYGTWNEALSLATGEYITNANLDDRKAPYSLERHAKALWRDESVSLVYADSYVTNQPNETHESNTAADRRYNFEEFSKEAMLRGNQCHNNPMWRRSLHEEYGLFDTQYRSAGDWEFFLRCAFGGTKFKKIPEVLGLYYFNPKGISTNFENFEWKQEEELKIYTKYKAIFDAGE